MDTHSVFQRYCLNICFNPKQTQVIVSMFVHAGTGEVGSMPDSTLILDPLRERGQEIRMFILIVTLTQNK